MALSPNRSPASVRRGVRHNARCSADGRWQWRYDLIGDPGERADSELTPLWDDVSSIVSPLMLIVGGASAYVAAADVGEMRRRLPAVRVEVVPGAGHAVQSSRPLALATLVEDFVFADR